MHEKPFHVIRAINNDEKLSNMTMKTKSVGRLIMTITVVKSKYLIASFTEPVRIIYGD